MVTPSSFASCLLVAATYLFRLPFQVEQNFAEDDFSGVVGDSTELGFVIFEWWPLVVAAFVSELVMVLVRRLYQQPATSQDGGARLSLGRADETDISDLDNADVLVGTTGLIAAAGTPAGVSNFASNDSIEGLSTIALFCDAGMQTERDMQAEKEMLQTMAACRVEGEEEERLRLRGERVEMEQQLAELRSRLGQAASERKTLERQLQEQGVRLLRAVVHNRKQNDASVVNCMALAEKDAVEVQCGQLKRELSALRVDLQARESELGQLRSRTNTRHKQWASTEVRLAAAGERGLRSEGPQHFDIGSDSSDEDELSVSDQKSIERCAERRVHSGAQVFARAGISRDQWHARRRTLAGPTQRASPQQTREVGGGTARKFRSSSRTFDHSAAFLNSPTGSSTSLEAKHVAHLHPPSIVRCHSADASTNPMPCSNSSHSSEQNEERRNPYGERHETPLPPFPRDVRNGHTHATAASDKLEVPMAGDSEGQSMFFAEGLPSQPGRAEGSAPVISGAKPRDAGSSRNAGAGRTQCLHERGKRHCDSHSHRIPSSASSDSSLAYSAFRAPHYSRFSAAEASTRAASPESVARSSGAEDISMSDTAICSVNSKSNLGRECVEIEGTTDALEPSAASGKDPALDFEEIYNKSPIDRVSLRIQQFERIARTVKGDRKEDH